MENCLCFNLRWVTRVITQFFDAEVRRHGIRPTQTPILTALSARSDWGMEELSDFLGMERTTLVRIFDRYNEAGSLGQEAVGGAGA